MCNCGAKRRAAAIAAAGGGGSGAPRGCSGPGCGVVRVVSIPLATPVPSVRTVRSGPFVSPVVAPVIAPAQMPTEEELPTVDTELWGPHMWRFLHSAAENTVGTTRRKKYWDALLSAMRTGLPCPDCREHYGTWLESHSFSELPPGANLQMAIKVWINALHNAVNVRRDLPEWTAEQTTATYASGGSVAAREALAAAAAAGVAPWVIAAGEEVVERAMM
jgi:hypothetical protein